MRLTDMAMEGLPEHDEADAVGARGATAGRTSEPLGTPREEAEREAEGCGWVLPRPIS